MFAALTVILGLELLTFGGVLREIWMGAFFLSVAGFAVVFVLQIARGTLDFRLLVTVASILILSLLTGFQFATGLLAGAWTWYAVRNSPRGVLRFFHVLILVGLLEALLGLFQYFVRPGWIFGYENIFNRVSGTFINHNHFAGALELLVFIPLGLAYTRLRQDERELAYIYLLASAFMGLAIVFSLSRMGMGSFFIALLILAILVKFRDGERNFERVIGLGLLVMIAAGVLWIGVDVVVDRYGQLAETGQESANVLRSTLYRDTFRMIAANPWGVGSGKYQDIFRQYQTQDATVLYDHAHNDFLETAAEWGVIPAAIFWLIIVAVLGRATVLFFRTEENLERGVLLGCVGSLVALMIHSLADFNLQIPANATLFFALLGIAASFPLTGPLSYWSGPPDR